MPRYYEDASEDECNQADDDDNASGSIRSSAAGRSEPRIEHTFIHGECRVVSGNLLQQVAGAARKGKLPREFTRPASASAAADR